MNGATILVACTGNVRRSPAAAALLRQGTASASGLEGYGVQVVSAGVRALVGDEVDPLIAAQLSRFGVSCGKHRARQITAEQVERADLIVTVERVQRREVVRLVPSAVRRTFTLLELAALGSRVGRGAISEDADAATRLRELVRFAPLERARRVVSRADVDDLGDIRRATTGSAARLVRELQSATEVILSLIEPEPALSLVARPNVVHSPSEDARSPARAVAG